VIFFYLSLYLLLTDFASIAPDPLLLAYHFFSVAFYSIWVMFAHPAPRPSESVEGEKPVVRAASLEEYPALFVESFRVFWTAVVVFAPLLWTEIRW
jgi:squalene monooxygenase